MRARLFGAAALCLAAALGLRAGRPPAAYVTAGNGAPLHHCQVPILFAVDDALPESVERAATDAFAYWESLSSRRLFVYAGRVPFGPDHPEAYGLVVVGTSVEHDRRGRGPTAFTRIRAVTDPRGCIPSAAVYIHPDARALSAVALTSALRHEVGHVLGLGHGDDPGGLMYRTTPRDLLKGLSPQELEAFRRYYE